MIPSEPVTTFADTRADRDSAVVLTEQPGDAVLSGFGTVDGRDFSLAGAVSWDGPVELLFPDGDEVRAHLDLSPDGTRLRLTGVDGISELEPSAAVVVPGGGSFAGRFESDDAPTVSLLLQQDGDLISGTGSVDGARVAIAGRASGGDTAEGLVLFGDGSRLRVAATLSSGGDVLAVEGFAATVQLQRR